MLIKKSLVLLLAVLTGVCAAGVKEESTIRLAELSNQIDANKATLNQAGFTEIVNEYNSVSMSLGGDSGIQGSGGVSQNHFVRSAPAIPANTVSTLTNVSDTPGSVITNGAPAQATLNVVSSDVYLWDVDLNVAITHTFASDLDITLTSPAGTVVTISTDNGSSSDNVFNGTLFDDDAVDVSPGNVAVNFLYTNLVTATPLVIEGALGAFVGEDPNGQWTIDIVDDAGGDNGVLVSWGLDITTLNQIPANDPIVTTSDAPGSFITTGVPVQDVINVVSSGLTVCDVNMQTNITHTFAGDLDITLTSPAGTVVTITTDNGSGNDNVFAGTLWDDSALTPVTDNVFTNLVTATNLVPEAAMAAFLGEDPNGNWILEIVDDAGGDDGTLVDWSLSITTCFGFLPPTFSKVFSPDSIAMNSTSTLTFTVDNTVINDAANALDFTDTLPAGMVVATPSNASTTCTGGTLTAVNGAGTVSYTGGSVGALASCNITVDVLATAVGNLINTTGDLTSSHGNSGTASDTLTVNPQPGFTKVFTPDNIALGDLSTLTFSIDNSGSTTAATALDFTDNLPAGMTVATPSNASSTCTGGTLTAAVGTGTISYSGGSAAASSSCILSVDVLVTTTGALINTTGDLTSSLGNSGTASDTLTVNPQPGFTKVFTPDNILIGSVSTLTFTIDNSGSTLTASALDFTDALPAGVVNATPSNASTTCTGGTLTAIDGTGTINYTGGSVAASSSCTVAVDVTSNTTGIYVNTTGDLTSSLGNSGTASDTLTVNGTPLFSAIFSPDNVFTGDLTTLTFTIDNSANVSDATALSFTNNLPIGLEVSVMPNVVNTCSGGSLVAAGGSSVISYSGGTVLAGMVCQISVNLISNSVGSYVNTIGDLTSSLGNSGGASSSLEVTLRPPPASVPTLSFWTLLLLMTLILIVSMKMGLLRKG